jgi:hypothetical protein
MGKFGIPVTHHRDNIDWLTQKQKADKGQRRLAESASDL